MTGCSKPSTVERTKNRIRDSPFLHNGFLEILQLLLMTRLYQNFVRSFNNGCTNKIQMIIENTNCFT